jgi:predicted O-methyltransferase YrrM
MKPARVTLWLLTATVLVASATAATSDVPIPWIALATATGLLAVLAALRLLSHRLWQLSAELQDAPNGAARSVVSELHSMQVVVGRFPECSLPTSGYSMTFGNLHVLLELLDELQPQTVVEFGSGMSTIMVAAWLKRRGHGRLRSFDHEPGWAARTSRHLARSGLDTYATVSVAPLVPTTVKGHSVNWYDLAAEARATGNIDFVIVDGPPSHEQPMARLPALFALESQLSINCCIALDDASRPEERAVAAIWRDHLPGIETYTISSQTGLAVFRRGGVTGQHSPLPAATR